MTSATDLATPLLLGFGLGLRHALDPDHLAAMGTIVAREPAPRRAAWMGAAWGAGHSAALFAASLALIVLRVPVPRGVSSALELAVAAMLFVLGIESLRRASGPLGTAEGTPGAATPRRPFVIGLIHGLAGSGGLMLLLLPTIQSPPLALASAALFGLGSVGGMALWSALLALPLGAVTRRSPRAAGWVPALSGFASVAAGVLLVAQVS